MWKTDELINFAKECKVTDNDFIKFLSTADTSGDLMVQYQKHLQSASTATSKFGAALKSAAANIGIMLAINVGIWAAGKAWDYFVNRVENLRKAAEESAKKYSDLETEISSINSELESTSKRIDELNKKEHLTFVEQDELQKLKETNEELERQLGNRKALANVAKQDANERAKEYFDSQGSGTRYAGWDMSQVEVGNTTYGQAIPDMYFGNQLEVAKQKLDDYENLLQQKADVEKRLSDYQVSNPTNYEKSDEYQNIVLESNAISNALDVLKKSLTDSITDFDKFDDSLDLENDKAYIDSLKEISDGYQNLFGGGKSATQSFDDIWNADTFSKARKELESMAQAGTLSPATLSNNETYNQLLKETGKTAEETCENIYALVEAEKSASNVAKSSSFTDIFSSLPTDKLEEYIALVKDGVIDEKTIGNYEELSKAMSQTGTSAEEAIKAIKAYSEGFKSSTELTQHIQESYDLLTKIQKEVDKTKQVSLDSLNSIAKQYPELTTATAEYAQGLISTADLMALLEQAYNNDANAFRTAMAAKLDGNEVFFNTIKQNNEGLFTALAKAYGVDVGNWKSMAQAKAEIDQALIQKLGAAWGQYYGVVIDQATGLASLINKTPTTGLTAEQSVDLIVARTNAESIVSSFNHAKEAMDKAAQIEVNLPNFGGIGGKSGSGGSKGSKDKEPTEFDWMEQKITNLDSQVDKLKTNIESLVGYRNKNSMTHTAIDVLTEKMTVLQQMHDEYMKKAGGLGLSQEYIDKIQNGTIEIETISDENLAKVIKEYQDLYGKASDANKRILETKDVIHNLNLSKLDHIINQFEQMTDIQSKMIDTEKQLIDLREKSGEEIYADDYISLAGKQLKLTRQNADAYNTLAAEMESMDLQEGTEEWKKYNDQLQEYKNNMISAADAIEQYKDSMTDLVYKGLRDFTNTMDSINGTISTMNDLIGNTNLVDEFGSLTDRGLAQVALYAHQMSNAKQEAAEYAEAINSLDDALDSGLITQDEYNSMLQEYTSAQESAVKSSKEAMDAILTLAKEGIQAEIDAKKRLIDETKAALDAEKDLHDYQKSITEKQDNISRLERQIAALSNSTNRNDIAQRLQLQSQLADAKEELYELQYDHEIEQRKNALDDEYNAFEESKQKESEELDTNLDAQNAAINKYLDQVKNNYSTVYGVLTQYGDEYSLAAIEDLTKPWESGSEAADLCANAIGDAVANIQYEIDGLDFSPLYELVDLLNQIGMGGYGGGSSGYEDVTDQGRWQKGKGGKWWYGNSNDDYVSGDIYTINGKQYGFDDNGYMVTGWRDDFGDWRYFEPENGEMVKSQWRKSRDNQWYYLDKDGIMATDMAVKAREKDGYYYLDDDGRWDGDTLTAEQVRKLGYTIGYKKGRKRITHDQLAWTQENEPELITRPSDGALLTPLKLGDGVINGDLTQNLLDIAGNPNRFVEDIVARSMPNYKIPEFDIVRNQPVAINSPLVQIDGTGLSASEVSAIIKNETRDIDKRVAKSIKYELMGK